MTNGLITLGGVLALLLGTGLLVGLLQRRQFSLRWLLIAVLLVAVNDALLTRAYGWLPDVIGGAWNWQGKLLALAATLVIALHPSFTWRRVGLTLRQAPGSLRSALPVALLYCGFFVGVAVAFPNATVSGEDLAFQLTLPGLEEETFYRGTLLLALGLAFPARLRFLGVDWGWGAVFSCAMFGLAHALGYSEHGFDFDVMTMALTALPSFIAVWLRLRTGSLVLPVVLHNFGNAITMLL